MSLRSLVVVTVAVGASSCNLLFPFAPDQVCESRIRAACHFAYSCCTQAERDALVFGLADVATGGFRNEGECVTELLEDGSAECSNAQLVAESSSGGRFQYDAALAEKCEKPLLDALNTCNAEALFGNDKLEPDSDCVGVTGVAYGTGKVKEKDGCFAAFECEDEGSLCDDQEADEGEVLVTAVGVCRSPAKEGEDCSADGSDGLCEPGTACVNDECTAIELLANGDACFFDGECDSGFCDDVTNFLAPVCADRFDNDEDCFDDNDCLSEFCDFANGSVCARPPKIVVDGCNGVGNDDTATQ